MYGVFIALQSLLGYLRPAGVRQAQKLGYFIKSFTGGVIALSLWQFMNDPRLARKAEAAEAAMREQGFPVNALDANDHLLGWQDSIQPVRYCHHFCESEVDALSTHLTQLGAREIARFSADGRSGTLNRYLICQVERPSRL